MRSSTIFSHRLAQGLILAVLAAFLPGVRALAAPPPHVIPALPSVVARGQAGHLGPVNQSAPMQIAVALPLSNPAGLQNFLQSVTTPGSANYHRYLSQDQANQQFDPSLSDEQRVMQWLQAAGLTITRTYPNHLLVDASGTTQQVNHLLHISMQIYHATVHGRDTTFKAPDTNPTIDGSVADVVSTVVGLDTYPRFTVQGYGTANGATPYYPQDFANAYDVNPLWNAGYVGTGEHIGVTLWTAPPSDYTLSSFATRTGAGTATTGNGRLNIVPVDGGSSQPDAGEAGMDIETASGMAPGATIDYYEAPVDSNGNPTDQGLLDALNQAGTDAYNNQEISNSWGGCEATSASDPWTSAAENIFASNAATGHTYFFASGDNGSSCDFSTPGSYQSPYPNYPASSPSVVSVGGSRFSASIGASDPGEVSWAYSGGSTPEGSGGGYSSIFARPSWQIAPGVSGSNRGYPDVSAVADPATGALVYYGGSASAAQVGGTSLATPLWAGITALLNQYVTAHHGSVGNLAATLYRLASQSPPYPAFHDITSGSNGQYSAAAGWDAVTGLGTPDAWNLARDLAGTTPQAAISATPNPVSASSSSTTVSWNTGSGADGQVWVAVNGGSQQLFASGPSGSADAPWINASGSYVFTLYSGSSHTTTLASATVTKAAPASISATPNPVSVSSGSGSTSVSWNTGDGLTGQVYVSVNGGGEVLFAQGASGTASAPWISSGSSYTFRLYSGTSHNTVLTSTTVTTSNPSSLSASPNPVICLTSGTTSVDWDTGDGTTGQVWVSVDNGGEELFTQGPSGSATAPWISPGHTYLFRLYAGTAHTTVLRSVSVACG